MLQRQTLAGDGAGLNSPILEWVLLSVFGLIWALRVRDIGVLKADAVITICGGFVWSYDLCVLSGWARVPPPSTPVRYTLPDTLLQHYHNYCSMGRIIPAAPCTTPLFASCLGLVFAWLVHQRW